MNIIITGKSFSVGRKSRPGSNMKLSKIIFLKDSVVLLSLTTRNSVSEATLKLNAIQSLVLRIFYIKSIREEFYSQAGSNLDIKNELVPWIERKNE